MNPGANTGPLRRSRLRVMMTKRLIYHQDFVTDGAERRLPNHDRLSQKTTRSFYLSCTNAPLEYCKLRDPL